LDAFTFAAFLYLDLFSAENLSLRQSTLVVLISRFSFWIIQGSGTILLILTTKIIIFNWALMCVLTWNYTGIEMIIDGSRRFVILEYI
jgi:hypothetical protein